MDENSTGNGYVVSWNPDPPNPPQLLADDPTNATLLSMWNYNETLYSLGGTSRPFCSFEISQELAGQLGVADLASRVSGGERRPRLAPHVGQEGLSASAWPLHHLPATPAIPCLLSPPPLPSLASSPRALA